MLTGLYDSWKEALLIVKPETVIRWPKKASDFIGDGKADQSPADRRSHRRK
jgi:hypothetical protein